MPSLPPGLRLVTRYRRAWLVRDVVAGLVLTTLLVPQGMAYAELAGLPAVTGLYTTITCLLGYALFGPSRILVLGPDSAIGPMIAATILPLVVSGGDPERAVALASVLALMVAAIMVVASVAGLGRVDGLGGYHDVRSYPDADRLPGLVIYRFDAPLFFANAKTFRDDVLRMAHATPPPSWIVVAAEPITDIDTTAADFLLDLDRALEERGQTLAFAGLKDPVRRKIERYGLTRAIEPHQLFPTVEMAVAAFRVHSDAEWAGSLTSRGSPEAP